MTFFNRHSWLGVAALTLAAAMPAQADLVTFEDLGPTFLFGGDSVVSGGMGFTSDGQGFSGVDTVDAFSDAGPPAGASGQFLYMLNSDGMTMAAETPGGFRLNSFSAAFLAPTPGLGGFAPGTLFVELYDLLGALLATEIFDFAIGSPGGDFPFASVTLANGGSLLSSAYFYACAYQTDESCERGGLLPAQFALDDIDVRFDLNTVAEPGTVLLVATAIGALAIRRRKTLH
jgi:hypothetical protein